MSTSARLREIRLEDNPFVAQVIRRVMTEFQCVGEGYSIEDPEVDRMFESYNNARSEFFVIERDSEVVGCGGYGPLQGGGSDTCELKKMYFLDSLRGQGWGRRLLTHCIEGARAKGYTKMYLETVVRMESANALYRIFGFRPLSEALGKTGHSSCDAFYSLDI